MFQWALRIAVGFLALAFILGIFGYGIAVERFKLPPYGQLPELQAAIKSIQRMVTGEKPWYHQQTKLDRDQMTEDLRPEPREPALNLITSAIGGKQLSIRVIDMAGKTVHEWLIDWFALVPDDTYLRESDRPKNKPGGLVHGTVLMPDGGIIFNFETKALIRLDREGDLVWRQPYLTHHSLEFDQDGYLWAPLKRRHLEEADARFPNLKPEFDEAVIARIDPQDGSIVEQISIYEILLENGLQSLLYMARGDPNYPPTGDIVHLNDVEVFSGSEEPGIFQPGDIMVSLRNVNAIVIFNPVTRKVRHHWIGQNFINQHDPDFIDSNRISIFDNNPVGGYRDKQQSRILIADARGGLPEVWYSGTDTGSKPFYSDRMGKHQWLGNGHMLVTSTAQGRGFELNAEGNVVWDFHNVTEKGGIGAVYQIDRLPDWAVSLFTVQ
jgi:hypothetical protein